MSWGLTVRIFQHLFEMGWLKAGDLVADPFSGIGTTGLVAASFGCPCILVELEPKFVALAEQSFELHRAEWGKMGKPYPVILCGDSRHFSKIVKEAVTTIITSPPFSPAGWQPAGQLPSTPVRSKVEGMGRRPEDNYGFTDGQIGAMKEGNLEEVVDAILTSPPYADSMTGKEPRFPELRSDGNTFRLGRSAPQGYGQSEGQLGSMPEGDLEEVVSAVITSPPYVDRCANDSQRTMCRTNLIIQMNEGDGQTYGHSAGQLGAMPEGDHTEVVSAVITSPPYTITRITAAPEYQGSYDKEAGEDGLRRGYSDNPANMGNLPEGSHEEVVEAIVTSPPFEKCTGDSVRPCKLTEEYAEKYDYGSFRKWYGDSKGQIGQEESETYWHSVMQVYKSCYSVLRSGGCLVVVVKSFVRQGKIVDLPSQTLELLEAIGFVSLERIRAWFVKSEYKNTLFDDDTERYFYEQNELKRRKAWEKGAKRTPYQPLDFDAWLLTWKQRKRVSFFRHLAELKGSPRIDFEEVLIVQKQRD